MRLEGFVEKGWGSELIWATNDKYCGKLLKFNKGAAFSMHFHAEKDESWYVLDGVFQVKFIDTTNASQQKALIERRTTLETAQRLQNLNAAIENASLGFARMTKEIGNSVASATGGFVRGIQGGQSSFELSAGLMSGAVDVANQGVQAAAGGLQGL